MKIGFIGIGNMGSAIAGGILKAGIVKKEDILVADKSEENLKKAAAAYGLTVSKDNKKVAENADILILAVKPNVIFPVIEEIKDVVKDEGTIVSIAAGRTIKTIEDAFEKDIKLVRVMPNTPALVGEAMSALSLNHKISQETYCKDVEIVMGIFESFGKAEIVPESLMDAVVGVSGSAPAYVFMLIEAMADAAVAGGMPRKQAYTFASQTVMGSAKMVLQTGEHPGALKDMVCSPAGTTIDGVAVLEQEGFRSAVMQAVKACIEKSKKL